VLLDERSAAQRRLEGTVTGEARADAA
jgi:hypothetical protein